MQHFGEVKSRQKRPATNHRGLSIGTGNVVNAPMALFEACQLHRTGCERTGHGRTMCGVFLHDVITVLWGKEKTFAYESSQTIETPWEAELLEFVKQRRVWCEVAYGVELADSGRNPTQSDCIRTRIKRNTASAACISDWLSP